jgi:hypothetical protein
MDAKTFGGIKRELLAKADAIARSKRPGYTQGNADVLHNFKASAQRAGVTPMQAWQVQFDKQLLSIATKVKHPKLTQGETMESRFADSINYLLLGYALMQDEAETATVTK